MICFGSVLEVIVCDARGHVHQGDWHVSDDKNPDVQGDEEAARRLAEQRKALNLQTRPLEVIADLDWDVDEDEFPAAAPAAAPAPVAAPAPAAVAPTASSAALIQDANAARGGTMMMSASEFANALATPAAPAPSANETVTAPAATVADPAPVAAPTVTRGGTMLITTVADADELLASAREQVADAAPVASPGGTILMSADAVTAQLEQEAGLRSNQATPAAGTAAVASSVDLAGATVQTAPNPDAGSGWDAPAPAVTSEPEMVGMSTPRMIAIGIAILVMIGAAAAFFIMK